MGTLFVVLLSLTLGLGVGPPPAGSETLDGWRLLQRGGFVVLIRHALAPGFGDPPGFRLEDCASQRNLSEEGRRQAGAMGEAFRRNGVSVEKVYSSQWCRCRETAGLAFGAFEELPALNSFFQTPELAAARTRSLIDFLVARGPLEGNLILVTHQVNITALTGVIPAQGEMVIASLEMEGRLKVEARLRLSD